LPPALAGINLSKLNLEINMDTIRLKTQVWRVVVLFLVCIAAVVIPIGIGLMLAFLGPPPYLLIEGALTPKWLQPATDPDGSTVTVRLYPDARAASAAASQMEKRLSSSSSTVTKSPWFVQYKLPTGRKAGVLMAVGRAVVRVEADTDEHVQHRLAALPFVRKNPRPNLMFALFQNHVMAMLAGVGIYALACAVGMIRGGTWAARLAPPKGVEPLPVEELHAKLLAINALDVPVQIRQAANKDLIAEWRLVDARWTGILERGGLNMAHQVRLRFDPDRHRVRTIDSNYRISWRQGVAHLSWAFSCFRGITFFEFASGREYGLLYRDGNWGIYPAYNYRYSITELKQPVIHAILSSGWEYQPVVLFARWLTG
jgi:hypothetical protein